MTSNWKECKLGDLCNKVTSGGTPKSTVAEYYKEGNIPWLNTKEVHFNRIYSTEKYITELGLNNSSAKWIGKNNVIVAMYGATAGNVAINKIPLTTNQACCNLEISEEKADYNFIYYYLLDKYKVLSSMANGGAQQNLNSLQIKDFVLLLPPLETQQKIVKVLSAIDDKIELNNSINNNLEQQVQSIFVNMFATHINNIENEENKLLSELVQNIDNRGKTPPLSINKTNYPIIDVRALSGNTRIINYNNCTKYVEEETYNNWFRNGHPQKYDILLSTVGSLAEMKLFLGNIGCIAQNVIGYRCNISPLYLYQYLNYIKKDLLAYDIGSVQPSIKVTHIAKHPIFIPRQVELQQFHDISFAMTNEIYSNCLENERLTQLRDTLLPKLMSGEIDVDKVEVYGD